MQQTKRIIQSSTPGATRAKKTDLTKTGCSSSSSHNNNKNNHDDAMSRCELDRLQPVINSGF